jgi:hypothetical protein
LVCLALGGGTPTAAFNWSWGTLPHEAGMRALLDQARQYVTQRPWLMGLLVFSALAFTLLILYLRSVCRFLLVEGIMQEKLELGRAWRRLRPLGRSYFRWLLASILLLLLLLGVAAAIAVRYLRAEVAAGAQSIAASVAIVAVLGAVVFGGLAASVIVIITDDLVVPVMYAEDLTLPRAWIQVWRVLRAEPGPGAFYVLVRFGVSLLTSLVLLFLLFPVVLTMLSAATIVSVLVLASLRLIGLHWVWSPLTLVITSAALLIFTLLLLMLLSVFGMPAQVLLQDFGIQFIAPRVSARRLLRPKFDFEPPPIADIT